MALTGGNIGFTGYQQPNYAGAVEAAGLPMQAIGQAVGQAADYFKQQGEKKKLIKQSDIQIDAALKLFPEMAPTLQGVRDQIKDENVSLNERADIAESVAGLINMGTKQMQANADFGLRKRQLDIEEGRGIQEALMKRAELEAEARKPGPITDVNVPGGVMQMRPNPQTGVLEPIQVAGIPQGTGLVNLVKGFEGFNPNAYGDYKQTSVGYGTKGKEGEVLTEAQATDRLNTELLGHAKRIEEAAKLKGVKLNQNQFNALTSFDFNTGRGADLIERFGDKPEELVSKMQEYTKAGGKELPGLVKRRGVEAALFLTPTESSIGFKPTKTEKEVKVITGDQAKARNLDPAGTYEESYENGKLVGIQAITAPPSITQLAQVKKSEAEIKASEAEIQKAQRAKDIAIKTMSDFIDDEGKPTERLDKAVGYGEAFATGVAEYAPILQTQSGETQSDQQRLNRLVETDILEAASLLKPVSNTDLLMLIKNRPTVTKPIEVWTKYLSDIKKILSNEDNYISSDGGSKVATPEKPLSATERYRAGLKPQGNR
jgi:lysozyme